MVCPGLLWVVWTRHQDSGNRGLPGLSLSPRWLQSCLVVATSQGLAPPMALHRSCPSQHVHVSPRSPGNQPL